ncbi:MAG: GNAT family N-acetyltransferase [Bacteroidota bacterium]
MTAHLRKKYCSSKAKGQELAPSIRYYRNIRNVPADWDKVVPEEKVLMRIPYLKALESAPPTGMQFAYILYYLGKEAIGVSYCQIQHFSAEKSIRYDEGEKAPSFFVSLGRYIRGFVASRFEFNTLVCGNLLFTGEHGFYFKPDKIDRAQMILLVDQSLQKLQKQLQGKSLPISVVLYKEFYADNLRSSSQLKDNSYNEFTIQPNMILDIPAHWQEFDHYLADLSSKYRVRTRRARKKLKDIQCRELQLEEVEKLLPRMYDLYTAVAGHSGFNVVNLNKNYLYALKKELPELFKIYGYFQDEKLIAFYTTLMTGNELEAHFLGFERSFNRSHQIYLNILYDLVQAGIDRNADRVIFARTALEIKSSVGAVAHEMHCYLRHRNSFSNRFLQPLLDYLRPDTDWQPRHPFK